jgi:hypothetical protein
MKMKHTAWPVAVLLSAMAAPMASAQVVISFSGGAPAASPVPLSPWLMAAMSAMLAVLGLMFIRHKAGRGLFVLVLSALTGSGALLQATEGRAYGTPVLRSVTTSGVEITGADVAWMTGPMTCGPIGYVWFQSGVGAIEISSIGYRPGYSFLNPASPPAATDVALPTPATPVCSVGATLSGSTSCIVWYQKASHAC